MKVLFNVFSLGITLIMSSSCSALAFPKDETTVAARAEKYDLDILETYRPTPEERDLYPERVWYFDNPDLFYNTSFYLTNDLGTSSPHLVEASNTTHWNLQSRGSSSSLHTLESRAQIHYINTYSAGGCIPDTFMTQGTNFPNGVCFRFTAYRVLSVFIVGEGNFQVNLYGGGTNNWCNNNYIGGVRAWSGCYTTPDINNWLQFYWPCFTC